MSLLYIIILAAGKATRFGKNKLLEPINGTPMIRKVVKSASDSMADEVVVVLGHEANLIKKTLEGMGCKFVLNKAFKRGQSCSVKAGLREVANEATAVIVLPGDVAFITAKAINAVIKAYAKFRSPIIVASHHGQLGHPILLDSSMFDDVMSINEETMGLKAILMKHRNLLKKANGGSAKVLIDIDTEQDLKRYAEHATS